MEAVVGGRSKKTEASAHQLETSRLGRVSRHYCTVDRSDVCLSKVVR